jgi:Flp pilus assembly protein protease CpaA
MNKTEIERMPSASRLIKFLCAFCSIAEVLVAMGFLVAIIIFPFTEKRVASGRERMAITIPRGALNVGFTAQFGSPSDSGQDLVGSGSIKPVGPVGSLTFGPLNLKPMTDTGSSVASLRPTEGLLTIIQPEKAAEALAFIRWPFLFSISCSGVLTVAILELFRRLLKSVKAREVFTRANIRNVNWIGVILIGSCLAKNAAEAWMVHRMVSFATSLPLGSPLEYTSDGSASGIAAGLLVLALAEVFRQGLVLKEENELTI